ncbi:MAG: DUF1365 domain-containing protein [Prolixibacteraceae bacterium]|nr:DUF1365 domain-containing protein [Burkholderiales bacterium]
MSPQLFHGAVFHTRLRPLRNAFRYRVFFLRFALSELHRLPNAVFSINRWNLFSFHYRDHGARDGSHPWTWIRALLAQEGLQEADGEIWLQAFPRMLGFVFNPISFWLCYDKGGALRAVLCEVNNTFGEHHHYLLAHPDHRPILDSDILKATKIFHVSPFCDIAGEYRFQFNIDKASTHIRIDYNDPEGKLLLTAISGKSSAYGAPTLIRAFVLYPWMTLGVVARIHLQALRLWIRGVPWFAKPLPPSQELTR